VEASRGRAVYGIIGSFPAGPGLIRGLVANVGWYGSLNR
jgi:cytosine/uracil/thiamine/allantoin permease